MNDKPFVCVCVCCVYVCDVCLCVVLWCVCVCGVCLCVCVSLCVVLWCVCVCVCTCVCVCAHVCCIYVHTIGYLIIAQTGLCSCQYSKVDNQNMQPSKSKLFVCNTHSCPTECSRHQRKQNLSSSTLTGIPNEMGAFISITVTKATHIQTRTTDLPSCPSSCPPLINFFPQIFGPEPLKFHSHPWGPGGIPTVVGI